MSPRLMSDARVCSLPCSAALALLLLCGLQAGCGGQQDTAPLPRGGTAAVPVPAVAGQKPGTDVGWSMDLSKLDIPQAAAAGRINGRPFNPDRAELKNDGVLTLRQGQGVFADLEVILFLFLDKGQAAEGTAWEVKPLQSSAPLTSIRVGWRVTSRRPTRTWISTP